MSSAKVLCAEHAVWLSGQVAAATVDFGGLHVRDESFVPTVTREQALEEAAAYFVDDVLENARADGSAICAQMEAGAPILKSPVTG